MQQCSPELAGSQRAGRSHLAWLQVRLNIVTRSQSVVSMKFSVKIQKGEKYFIARVPELGITTQGRTKAEARRNLREAIQTHLEAMADYAIEHGGVAIEKGQLVAAA